MAIPVQFQYAQQIVDTLKSICDHDINYINREGRIIASTDPARVGDYHEGGYRAGRSGEIVAISSLDFLLSAYPHVNTKYIYML